MRAEPGLAQNLLYDLSKVGVPFENVDGASAATADALHNVVRDSRDQRCLVWVIFRPKCERGAFR